MKTDWIRFLADTERSYADEMRTYLKKDLGVHASIIDSQIYYGCLCGLYREANSDFADMHAYWNHPQFPHGGWNNNDFTIDNTCMVSDLAAGNGGTFRKAADNRVAGKPYTISEYQETAPCEYQSEALPLIATYAARQDYDMFCLFDYGSYGASSTNDAYEPFFGIAENTAKLAFLPAAAEIFRAGGFAPAGSTTTLHLPQDALFQAADIHEMWKRALTGASPDLTSSRLAVTVDPNATASTVTRTTARRPDTSSIRIVKTSSGAEYLATDPRSQAASGFVGGQTVTLGPAKFVFPTFGNNFASLTLTAMDGQKTQNSGKLLLAIIGKCENTGMVWNAARTNVDGHWGTGPVLAEAIPATVTIQTSGARRIWALDTTGKRKTAVPVTYSGGAVTFRTDPQYGTVWYEIGK
jgi:hypothetical protein